MNTLQAVRPLIKSHNYENIEISALAKPTVNVPQKDNMTLSCDITGSLGLPPTPTMTHETNGSHAYSPFNIYNNCIPVSNQHLLQICRDNSVTKQGTNTSLSSEDEIDVVNDSGECSLRTTDLPNNTDSSISTQGSASSSPSSSTTSLPSSPASEGSPGSTSSSNTSPNQSPDPSQGPVKKKVRTNYSPSQVQALERVFHENPYPDPDMMESLSRDLGVAESRLKIWFQNKRARWRRRVQNSMNNNCPQFMPMTPMLSPVTYNPRLSYNYMMTPPMSQFVFPGTMTATYSTSPSSVHTQATDYNTPSSSRVPPRVSRNENISQCANAPLFYPALNMNMNTSTQRLMTSSPSVSQYSPTLYPYNYGSTSHSNW